MSKRFFAVAFAIGLTAVVWVGAGFVATNWVALAMTVVIAGVYLLGANELRQYRAGSAGLASALENIPQPLASLADWLGKVPPALRNAVRLRVEGERVGLPGPALTPYLVGLLVMLGMLGTFLGMVVTFKGAVFALEGSTNLRAIRSALAEPIKGLGLAFGTSVAGVAASAMLGLMSAIARRERLELARTLDGRIATVLQPFSLTHQRQETFKALQAQAQVLPEVAARLEAMMERIEQRSQQLDDKLLAGQALFHREAAQAYTGLADGVGASLKDSLQAGARAAGESIRPVVEQAMAQIVQDTARMHERLDEGFAQRSSTLLAGVDERIARTQQASATAEQQRLQAWTQSLQAMAGELQGQWRRVADEAAAQQIASRQALEQSAAQVAEHAGAQAAQTARLLDASGELVRERTAAEARWIEQHGQRMDELAGLWRTELAALRSEEQSRGQAAVDRLGELQAAVAQHLATLGAALEAPLTRLLQTASEVPQAAAGVIAQLREEVSRLAERDNATLQERTALVEQLGTLVQGLNQAAGEQHAAIEALVASATTTMQQATESFATVLEAQAGKAADSAAHVTASAVELASWGDAFGAGVQGFQASNDKLLEGLQRIEASLNKSTARSDEQLAYYVAQAREVIDLSIASQEGIVEQMRQLQGKPPAKPLALVEGARA
ncbi:MAG TPA: hypothetical protein VLJ58_10220 [Ramlibacter sp.]|nr:hypothetical protein [Ramlibacter sp.]